MAEVAQQMASLSTQLEECKDNSSRFQTLLGDATAECDTLRKSQSRLIADGLQISLIQESMVVVQENNDRLSRQLNECRQSNEASMAQLQTKFLTLKSKHTSALRTLQQTLVQTKEEKDALMARRLALIPGMVYEFVLDDAAPEAPFFTYASPACQDIFGISPLHLLENPRSGIDTIHPDDKAAYLASTAKSYANLGSWDLRFRVVVKGKTKHLHGQSTPRREVRRHSFEYLPHVYI